MSSITKQLLGSKARNAILEGVNKVYDPVKLTLGPEGGNALMYRTYGRGPRITNDGVTISEVIEPQDEFENLAAGAFKEASKRTNERVGDGTTTTIVIAGYLLNEVFGKLSESSSDLIGRGQKSSGVMQLKKAMIDAGEKVEGMIADRAEKILSVEDLYKIATVSVEDPEIGKTVADMVYKTGVDGFIDVIEGHTQKIDTDVIEGMRFPAKVSAKAFLNNPSKFEMVAEDVSVFITNYVIDNPQLLARFTKRLTATTKLAIFAPSFSDSVLLQMIASAKQGFFFYPVKTPALRTEQYEDLSAYCDASFIDKNKGRKFENVQETELGFLERLIVKDVDAREDAVATGGRGASSGVVKERIEILKKQKEETKEEIHKKVFDRRIASMSSAIGQIKVGAPSQAEQLYLLKKIEDAVYACKAALEEGYVQGGGLCLKEIADEIAQEDSNNILLGALRAPYNQIQENAGEELPIGEDIIDPAKVVRLAVGHAVSVVAHLATVKIMIPEIRERNPAEGYGDIAKAINRLVYLSAKERSMVDDNLKEEAEDNERSFQDNLLKDLN